MPLIIGMADFAATSSQVYCLHQCGKVDVFNVPELEHIETVIPPPADQHDSNSKALRISCGTNGKTAIMWGVISKQNPEIVVEDIRIIVYDRDWSYLRTIVITGCHVGRPRLVLTGNEELVLNSLGICWTFYYIHYGRALAAHVDTRSNLIDHLTAVCDTGTDAFDVCWIRKLERWHLTHIRRIAIYPCEEMDGILTVKLEDLNKIRVRSYPLGRTLYRIMTDNGFVKVDKITGDLFVVTSSSMTVYNSNDLTRPLESHHLPFAAAKFKDDFRLDNIDIEFAFGSRGLRVSGFDNTEDAKLSIAFGNNLLIWPRHGPGKGTSLSGCARDVFCHESNVYVLMDDEIQILNAHALEDEPQIVPITLNDGNESRLKCDRMVHHENLVVFILASPTCLHDEFVIFKMHLTGDRPHAARLMSFPCDLTRTEQINITVDGDGRLIVYRKYLIPDPNNPPDSDPAPGSTRSYHCRMGVEIYSSEGELVRTIPIDYRHEQVLDITICPGGGIFILGDTGLRHMQV